MEVYKNKILMSFDEIWNFMLKNDSFGYVHFIIKVSVFNLSTLYISLVKI